jgi:hypothetical protein
MWWWLRNSDAGHHRSACNDRSAGGHYRRTGNRRRADAHRGTYDHGTGYDHD